MASTWGKLYWGLPDSSVGKESACDAGDLGSIHGLGRSPGEGNGNPFQYSCLENPKDRGGWQATVHSVPGVGHDLALSFLLSFFSYWRSGILQVGTARSREVKLIVQEHTTQNAELRMQPKPSALKLVLLWAVLLITCLSTWGKGGITLASELESRKGAGLGFAYEKPGDCHLANYAKNLYPTDP